MNSASAARSRRGIKLSKRQHNLEGLLGKELRQRETMDTPPSRYYRKRRRRELAPEEIEKIVATSREPYQRYEDIAKHFRISKRLVYTLISESKN